MLKIVSRPLTMMNGGFDQRSAFLALTVSLFVVFPLLAVANSWAKIPARFLSSQATLLLGMDTSSGMDAKSIQQHFDRSMIYVSEIPHLSVLELGWLQRRLLLARALLLQQANRFISIRTLADIEEQFGRSVWWNDYPQDLLARRAPYGNWSGSGWGHFDHLPDDTEQLIMVFEVQDAGDVSIRASDFFVVMIFRKQHFPMVEVQYVDASMEGSLRAPPARTRISVDFSYKGAGEGTIPILGLSKEQGVYRLDPDLQFAFHNIPGIQGAYHAIPRLSRSSRTDLSLTSPSRFEPGQRMSAIQLRLSSTQIIGPGLAGQNLSPEDIQRIQQSHLNAVELPLASPVSLFPLSRGPGLEGHFYLSVIIGKFVDAISVDAANLFLEAMDRFVSAFPNLVVSSVDDPRDADVIVYLSTHKDRDFGMTSPLTRDSGEPLQSFNEDAIVLFALSVP